MSFCFVTADVIGIYCFIYMTVFLSHTITSKKHIYHRAIGSFFMVGTLSKNVKHLGWLKTKN